MQIHEKLKSEIMEALRAKDQVRLTTLRSLVTAMTNEVISKKRKPDQFLTDDEALTVLKRASNQRKDSIEQFEKAGRDDLASTEKAELEIIKSFLPEQIPYEEIETAVKTKISELGVTNMSEAGKLIGALMKDFKGKADGADVKTAVEKLLS